MTQTDTTEPDWEAGCSCGWHGMSEDADDHPCSLPTYHQCPFDVTLENGTALDALHNDVAVLADPRKSTIYTRDYPNQLQPLAERRLGMIRDLEEGVRRATQQLVDDARAAGMTWDAIGYELRVSRQAAQKRFGGAK